MVCAAAATWISAPAQAFTLSDLYWRPEADAMLEGGPDLPGQITGRPDLNEPTSMAFHEGGLLRADYVVPAPLDIKRGSFFTFGHWKDKVVRQRLVVPVKGEGFSTPWILGIEMDAVTDVIDLSQAGINADVRASVNPRRFAVAYRGKDGWIFGGVYGWGDEDVTLGGASLLDALGGSGLPRLHTNGKEFGLGVSKTGSRLGYGAQYTWMQPTSSFSVGPVGEGIELPRSADGHRAEAYLTWTAGRDVLYLSGRQIKTDNGTNLGLGPDGVRTSLALEDDLGAIGWRRAVGPHRHTFVVDRRVSRADGGLSLTSGAAEDRIGAGVRVATWSARYGYQRDLTKSGLYLGVGVSGQLSEARLSAAAVTGGVVRASTIIPDGKLSVGSATGGLGFRNRDWDALISYTYAAADTRDFEPLTTVNPKGVSPLAQPGLRLEPKPFWSFTASYKF
jgi:hypothetical protein